MSYCCSVFYKVVSEGMSLKYILNYVSIHHSTCILKLHNVFAHFYVIFFSVRNYSIVC